MIIHNNLFTMKSKFFPTCLQVYYRDSLGEFSNTSAGVFGGEQAIINMDPIDRVSVQQTITPGSP